MGNLLFFDQVNPQQSSYFSESISRGVTPNNAYPFSYRPHYAQYVDPDTGNISKIIVVPSAMVSQVWELYIIVHTVVVRHLKGLKNATDNS